MNMTMLRPRGSGSAWRAAFWRVTRVLLAPGAGLIVTWFVLNVTTAAIFGPKAGELTMMGGLTGALALMIVVAAYMPPSRPFREISALTARIVDLVKVVTGAALFGAAAAYGGAVSACMSRLPIGETLSVNVMWGVTSPILAVATVLGASVVGLRLGWDFRRAGHRGRLVALARLRSRLPAPRLRRNPLTAWLAGVVVAGSRSGVFMLVGYFTPVIIVADVALGIACVSRIG